jgi:hypothetical protein
MSALRIIYSNLGYDVETFYKEIVLALKSLFTSGILGIILNIISPHKDTALEDYHADQEAVTGLLSSNK